MILHRIILLICVLGSNAALRYKDIPVKRFLNFSRFLGDLSKMCFKNHPVTIHGDVTAKRNHFYMFKNIHPDTPVLFMENFTVHYDIVSEDSWEVEEKNFDVDFLTKYNILLFTYTEHHLFKPSATFNSINNINTFFFIVSMKVVNCNNAQNILDIIYRQYPRIYYYLCINLHDQLTIYTINPFATRAPSSWKHHGTVIIEHGRKLSIFFKAFQKEHTCHHLIFDRTTHIDNYPLQVAVPASTRIDTNSHALIYRSLENKDFKNMVRGYFQEFVLQLHVALNVSVGGYVFDEYNKEVKTQVFYHHQVRGIQADMILTDLPFDSIEIYQTLKFPARRYHYGIASRNHGPKSVFEKMQDLYGIKMLLLTIFVLTVTFFVVWLIERRFSFAAFGILRLLITNSLETRMITLSSRILFGTVFLYFLMMQATFSGSMVNFVTLFVKRSNAEGIDDLLDPQYEKIYMLIEVHSWMSDLQYKLLFSKIEYTSSCLRKTIKNPSVACVSEYHAMYNYLLNYTKENRKNSKIHISTKPIFDVYAYYLVRPESLLNDRLKIFMIQKWESGIHPYLIQIEERHTFIANRRFQDEHTLKIDEKKPIKLKGLVFAFIFLGFGLFCATLCFFIELFMYRRYVRRKKREKIEESSSHVSVLSAVDERMGDNSI